MQLVELYTSQGCSSCPPAEAWLGRFLAAPDLWRRRVPLNFHVDYWDRLGWSDPYASPLYTRRQYDYVRQLGLGSAYTPGFIVDGREWRGFLDGFALPEPGTANAGELSASLRGGVVHARFEPGAPVEGVEVHVAVLGSGLEDDIRSGENRGRRLRHDFVVLGHEARRASAGTAGASADPVRWTAEVPLPRPVRRNARRWALAIWVARASDHTPLQATGDWIDEPLVALGSSRAN